MNNRNNFCWSLEKGDLLPVLLMTPAMLLIAGVMVMPLGFGFFLSFFDFSFGGFSILDDFAGLQNYARILGDATARRSILNTLLFSAGAITLEFVIGTIIAVFLFHLSRMAGALIRPPYHYPVTYLSDSRWSHLALHL